MVTFQGQLSSSHDTSVRTSRLCQTCTTAQTDKMLNEGQGLWTTATRYTMDKKYNEAVVGDNISNFNLR